MAIEREREREAIQQQMIYTAHAPNVRPPSIAMRAAKCQMFDSGQLSGETMRDKELYSMIPSRREEHYYYFL